MSDKDPNGTIGRGKPPIATRFQKGHSGNPRGRPKAKVALPPYESVLGQLVTVSEEDQKLRQITVEEAFLQRVIRKGLDNDLIANQQSLKAIKKIKTFYSSNYEDNTTYIWVNSFLFSVNDAAVPLKMVRKLGKDGPDPRILLEPWLVQAALARFDDRELSKEEQREVWSATRTPAKVQWPSWWTQRRGTGVRNPVRPLKDEEGFYPPCVAPRRANENS